MTCSELSDFSFLVRYGIVVKIKVRHCELVLALCAVLGGNISGGGVRYGAEWKDFGLGVRYGAGRKNFGWRGAERFRMVSGKISGGEVRCGAVRKYAEIDQP